MSSNPTPSGEAEFTNDSPDIAGTGEADDGMLDGLMPSRGKLLVVVAVVVVAAVVAWRFRDGGSSSGSEVNEEIEEALNDDLAGEVEISDADEDGRVEIEVPVNPDDELEKDAAVLDALKQSGKFNGAEDE